MLRLHRCYTARQPHCVQPAGWALRSPARLWDPANPACTAPAPPQILRAFNVPTHPSKLKDAYRLAVRMYHPDSNSKEKVSVSVCGGG